MPRRQFTPLDLTQDETLAYEEMRQLYANDWPRYARECLAILDRNPKDPRSRLIPFNFNHCQSALWDLEVRVGDLRQRMALAQGLPTTRRPVRILVLKARKVGVSTYVQGRFNHLCEFTPHTEALMMAHRQDAANNIAEINRRFFHQFNRPTHPLLGVEVDPRSPLAEMGDTIKWNPQHASKMTIKTAGSGGGRGKGASRSYTYNAMHISEEAWFGDISELAPTLAAATPDVLSFEESTANGRANRFYERWASAMWIEELEGLLKDGEPPPSGWNDLVRFFWPWHADPHYQLPLYPGEGERIRASLTEPEQKLLTDFGVTYEQLKWRRQKLATECQEQTEHDPEDYFCQEYPSTPEEAFLATGDSVFHQGRLAEFEAQARELGRKAIAQPNPNGTGGGRFGRWFRWDEDRWELRDASWTNADYVEYAPPRRNHWYVMGIDTAEGLEHGDASVISIFDRTSITMLEEVARLITRNLSADELGELAYYLGVYYRMAFIVGERNPPGNVTTYKLFDKGYQNLYIRDDEEAIAAGDTTPKKFKVGFSTNRNTKPMIVEKAATALKDRHLLLRHPQAIREWQQFSRIDGKLMAPPGYHDDCVIADCLAIFGHWCEKAPIVDPNQDPTGRPPEAPADGEDQAKERIARSLAKIRSKYERKHEAQAQRQAQAMLNRFMRARGARSLYD